MGAVTENKLSAVLPRLLRSQTLHGPDHPYTHRARYDYARLLLAAGRRAEALEYAEAAVGGYQATVGEKHAWTSEALKFLVEARQLMDTARDTASVLH
jgi:hypothetical protein